MSCVCNVQCGAQNVECYVNVSAFKSRSAADHARHLVMVPEEHLCYSENVFNYVFFKRNSDFLYQLVSK